MRRTLLCWPRSRCDAIAIDTFYYRASMDQESARCPLKDCVRSQGMIYLLHISTLVWVDNTWSSGLMSVLAKRVRLSNSRLNLDCAWTRDHCDRYRVCSLRLVNSCRRFCAIPCTRCHFIFMDNLDGGRVNKSWKGVHPVVLCTFEFYEYVKARA